MTLRPILGVLATSLLALPLAAQMGMGMGSQVPTLSGIWHPVVGSGAVYEATREGKKNTMDFTVVGTEDIGGKTGYWVESAVTTEKGEVLVKVLETVDGDTISFGRSIIQMPGQGPMELDMGNTGPRKYTSSTSADFRNKAVLVGTESVTVPAGTFSCQHYHMKDGSGDGWISDKVSPWSLVKMQENERTTVLVKVTTDAKDRITGTPTKFDPMQMMRNRMGQQ